MQHISVKALAQAKLNATRHATPLQHGMQHFDAKNEAKCCIAVAPVLTELGKFCAGSPQQEKETLEQRKHRENMEAGAAFDLTLSEWVI